jgi:5-methylcytosine-specific restriction endonuclease McrA
MPSSKNYKRDYKQEAASESRERKEFRLQRNQARRAMIAAGKVERNDGKDVDHKVPLSQGGSNTMANLRVRNASGNRSYQRNSDGSIKRKK